MASVLATNCRPRKSLAAELDRLDKILDCLSDGLNEAVRDTVAQVMQGVVREAVEVAVGEALANAQMRAHLSPTQPSGVVSPIRRGWRALLGAATACWNWTTGMMKRARNALIASTADVCGSVRTQIASSAITFQSQVRTTVLWSLTLARLAIRLRRPLLLAVGVGVAVSSGSYLAGPIAASTASGLSVTLLTLSCLALKRLQCLIETMDSGVS